MQARVERSTRTSKPRARRSPGGGPDTEAGGRLVRLVNDLGNNGVAELLGVSRSQPSRWRRGLEHMGPGNERRVVDLDYLWTRLLLLFTPRQAEIWMTSYNAHLGARPVDVLRLRGAVPVVQAIDAEAQGAYV